MKQLILFSQCLVIVEAMAAIAGFITWKKWKHSLPEMVPGLSFNYNRTGNMLSCTGII